MEGGRMGQERRFRSVALRRQKRALNIVAAAAAAVIWAAVAAAGGLKWAAAAAAGPVPVGFCYGRNGRGVPPPASAARLLSSVSVTRARIYDYDASAVRAFAGAGVDLVITIPNEELPRFAAAGEAEADAWVASTLLLGSVSATVSAVSVGTEVLTAAAPALADALLPAMTSVRAALARSGLSARVHVTTAHSMAVLESSYPPSAGRFNSTLLPGYVRPIADFLAAAGSPFVVNAHPYHAYVAAQPDDIALDYALFQPRDAVLDPRTGLRYSSLLAAQLDAVYFALEAIGHAELAVVAGETGWPSAGGPAASVPNAAAYNNNLLRLVRNGTGTPYRPARPIDAYVFALYDEPGKPGNESERHWGAFDADGDAVYYLDLAGMGANGTQRSFNATAGPTWCVASPAAPDAALLAGLDFACGAGNADCGPIQPGHPCFLPDTYAAHASYAYNSYYQRSGDNSAACDFNGSAIITTVDPSYGSCVFPFDAVCPIVYSSSARHDAATGSTTAAASVVALLCFVAAALL